MGMAQSKDIDGRWALVVIAGYFYFRFIALGLTLSPSILYSTMLSYFEESPVMTAWAINLNTFVTYMCGEVANVFISHCGYRLTVTVGCLLSSLGIMVTAFASNLNYVFVFYGFITGVGYCMIYIGIVPVVAQYFDKYRKMAFLLSSSGTCIGQFVLPLLFRALSETYGWRGALIIISGLHLNLLVSAASLMPIRMEVDEAADNEELQKLKVTTEPAENEAPHDVSPPVYRRPSWQLPQFIRNMQICRKPSLALFFLSWTFISFGGTVFMTLIKNFALHQGHTDAQATLLQSLVGIMGLIDSVVIVCISRNPRVKISILAVVSYSLLGLCIASFGFLKSYDSILIVTCMFGFLFGINSAYLEIIIAFVGVENVAVGLSYCGVTSAVGILLGGTIGAYLYELDPSYVTSFVSAGGLCILGTLLYLPSMMSYRTLKCRL